jgi:hypothetical protein
LASVTGKPDAADSPIAFQTPRKRDPAVPDGVSAATITDAR